MDSDTAGPYIAAYEEVYRHNLTVEEATETIQEIVVGAGVVSVNESGDGDEVVVYVEFFWTYVGDGTDQPSAIVDGQPYEATYFVNETTTNRRGDTLE